MLLYFVFMFLFDLLISFRVGVGFDTKGAGTVTVKGPKSEKEEEFVVPDSREGMY